MFGKQSLLHDPLFVTHPNRYQPCHKLYKEPPKAQRYHEAVKVLALLAVGCKEKHEVYTGLEIPNDIQLRRSRCLAPAYATCILSAAELIKGKKIKLTYHEALEVAFKAMCGSSDFREGMSCSREEVENASSKLALAVTKVQYQGSDRPAYIKAARFSAYLIKRGIAPLVQLKRKYYPPAKALFKKIIKQLS